MVNRSFVQHRIPPTSRFIIRKSSSPFAVTLFLILIFASSIFVFLFCTRNILDDEQKPLFSKPEKFQSKSELVWCFLRFIVVIISFYCLVFCFVARFSLACAFVSSFSLPFFCFRHVSCLWFDNLELKYTYVKTLDWVWIKGGICISWNLARLRKSNTV